jgi:hypothetical protein
MSEIERDELEFLARARRGLSPSEGDAKRVLAALGPALLPGATPETEALPKASGVAPASAAGTSGVSWLAALAISGAVGVGALGAGYYWGYRMGTAESAARQAALPAATNTDATREPPRRAESPKPAAPPSATQESAPERVAPALRAAAASAPSEAPKLDDELEEETRQLARIERALRDQNPRFALGLLGELDRNIPDGQLAEERDAARAMARCQLDADFAAKSLRDFSERHPGSAYLARVKQLCAKGATNSSTAETDSGGR